MRWRPAAPSSWLWLVTVAHWMARAQLAWTPIYYQNGSQVDMWTLTAHGCPCKFDAGREGSCACCVNGGCDCEMQAPNRCAQCGIQQYCNNMCNITMTSRNLMEKSGKSYGQIKSPSMEGPFLCWYRLLPDSTQRVEIQVYRLVSVGRRNGTSCVGGLVQLNGGLDTVVRPRHTQLCGANERYTPAPIVMIEDRGAATLIFHVSERTERSQMLAYFSFTARNATTAMGFQPRGGRRIEKTDCDWVYQDGWCRGTGGGEGGGGPCRLATPGHPGIFPPHKVCKYLITTANPHTRVKIKFTSFSLPTSEGCCTDSVQVFHGSSPSSPLIAVLCGTKKQEVVHTGPNLLVQFSSGPLVSPYNHSGFVAVLEFSDRPVTAAPPAVASTQSTLAAAPSGGSVVQQHQQPCELLYFSNQSRNGLFDSRGLLNESQPNCTLVFTAGPTELVFISLANYNLKGSDCRSSVELVDGSPPASELIKRICGPAVKRTRDSIGRFQHRENYISKSNVLRLTLWRSVVPSRSMSDMEYVQGAFLFHDELVQGTPTPSSLCDVGYYGTTSRSQGTLTGPGETEIYWTINGRLECTQRLAPAANQSVSLNIMSLRRLAADTHCHTECGDGGCQCVNNLIPLDHMDHLLILTDTGLTLCCICGPFQEDWLPVGIRSWGPLRLVYYVARYNWATKGFEYETDYRFQEDHTCGHHVQTKHSGVIDSANVTVPKQLNYFLHQTCSWLLDSKVERQVSLSVNSDQRRPCSAWNLSIFEYQEPALGKPLHTFCSKDGPRNYTLPFRVNIVVIRLSAMTHKQPHFRVMWRSQVVRSSTRTSGFMPTATADTLRTDRSAGLATAVLVMLIALALR